MKTSIEILEDKLRHLALDNENIDDEKYDPELCTDKTHAYNEGVDVGRANLARELLILFFGK